LSFGCGPSKAVAANNRVHDDAYAAAGGHDHFSTEAIVTYFPWLLQQLGLTEEQFLALGLLNGEMSST